MDRQQEAELRLDKERHVKYWTRCLKTLLPHHYTGNESNRMYLAFFIVSALDLLGAWQRTSVVSAEERSGYIDWIYRCQHPRGGFRMWPGTDFGERSSEENAKWDPANLPATYFALAALLVLGDDMTRVHRRQTLLWLRNMQRPDGSFGETNVDGRIEGGRDPRFGYCATGVRYILRGHGEGALRVDGERVEDVDVDALVRCVQASETFDGGLADEPFHEPHAGYTFCSLGCVKFANRLRTLSAGSGRQNDSARAMAPRDPAATLRWLSARQTDLSDPAAECDGYPTTSPEDAESKGKAPRPGGSPASSAASPPLHQSPDKTTLLPDPFSVLEPAEAGMNGRTNKAADTCYAWWVTGSLHVLQGRSGGVGYCCARLRRYLLGSTQHAAIGGFGKFPGDLPDLYHSYLGLAALGLLGSDAHDIKPVDPAMCISSEASSRLPGLWERWEKAEDNISRAAATLMT